MSQVFETGLMWFRRDLRMMDNAALHLALSQCARSPHADALFAA